MSLHPRQLVAPWVALPVLIAILMVLGLLQYRWSAQASEAEQERMRRGLVASAQQLRGELVRAFQRPCAALRLGRISSAEAMRPVMADRIRTYFSRTDIAPGLVARLYGAFPDGQGGWLLEQATSQGGFTPQAWPDWWGGVERELTFNAQFQRHSDGPQDRSQCMIDPDTLVMHSAVLGAGDRGREPLGYLLIEMDRALLQREYLPDLVRRYFGGLGDLEYRVAVVRGGQMGDPVYQTDPPPTLRNLEDADAVVEVFSQRRGSSSGPPSGRSLNRSAGPPPDRSAGPPSGRPPGPRRERRFDGLPTIGGSAPWHVVVQHRAGSLAAAGASLRRRNLALGFGVLALLAASGALLVYSAQRARYLARLQMEFVAGVSHELRTPVTAIRLMADNLAGGTVTTPQQARHYGLLLQQQGRRLATMVEQILQFAAHQQRRPTFELQPVGLADVVAKAVAAERPLIEAAGMRVEQSVAADLPLVRADEAALQQCVENLLSNAVKYADTGGWIGIRAEPSPAEVRLVVQDRGPGILPEEQEQVFDPFFRGTAARGAQRPGTGLGLSLVRQMVEAMGGRVSVETKPGEGSAFTLHLGVGPPAPSPLPVQVRS